MPLFQTNKPRTKVAESLYDIRRRYEDTSVVLFKERQKGSKAGNFLSYGDRAPKSYAYTSYGNSAVVIQRRGNNVTKADEKGIESRVCSVM